jgi:hypothetical protein
VARRFRNPGANDSMGRDPEIWLPRFASRIAPYFVPPGLDLPEIGSERLSWLMDPLFLDELEAALDLCNKSCPGLDGLRFSIFKAPPPEAKLCLFDIYNDILRTGVVPESWYRTKVEPIFKTREKSRAVGFVQTDKFARLWTKAHGEDNLYTAGLLGREKWNTVFHSIWI